MRRLEAAADNIAASGEAHKAELKAVAAERDDVKARAGDLAERLDSAVARLKAAARETV